MRRWVERPNLVVQHRKEWLRWIEEAKPETRTMHLAKTVAAVREGRRAH